MLYLKQFNWSLILYLLGHILVFEGVFMLLAFFVSLFYGERDIVGFEEAIAITFGVGIALSIAFKNSKYKRIGKKDSFIIVTITWIAISFFGSLPFYLSNTIPSFTNAFFESISGFTTTGSSILTDIESLPHGILFWRSLTHWVGGMGIIVLVVAIIPFLKIGGMHLFNAESSMSIEEKFRPRIFEVAKRLWYIYIGITLLEVVFLCLGGMNLFESVCHSFGTIATGGFSPKNDSIASYSPYIQYVIAFFMLVSGINFALHYLIISGRIKKAFANEELKLYLKIIFFVTVIIAIKLFTENIYGVEESFRLAFFQVVSIITATGFATADYLQWPTITYVLIFILMFVGACAGSTGGGIKVIRHLMFVKHIKRRFFEMSHSNAYCPIRYGKTVVSTEASGSAFNFIMVYIICFLLGSLLLIGLGNDIGTSMGGVITSMGGIGPGFGTVGPASNFAHLSVASKWILTFFMVLGRLEIFTLLVLFTPAFWKR